MSQNSGEISVKVISVVPLTAFEGEAIRADPDPRHVVAFTLGNSKQNYSIHGTDVEFPSHQVAFFAIHSVTQLFRATDSEIIGQNYRLRISMETVGVTRRYQLERP